VTDVEQKGLNITAHINHITMNLEAVETLVDLMRHSKDDRVRGTASQALLDRGWGKAKVEAATSGGESYIEALQAAAKIIRLKNKER
jgi:hypothetical protein